MPTAAAFDWERFLDLWDEVFKDDDAWKDVLEGTVALRFAGELLTKLGWPPSETPSEVTFTVQAGREEKSVRADVVLAPDKTKAEVPGEVYGVIELKRPSEGDSDSARLQAQSYANHLHAPVYAVVDGDRIRIWHRRIVKADKLELELPRAEFKDRFDEIQAFLGASELKALHAALCEEDIAVEQARERCAALDHTKLHRQVRVQDGRLIASCTQEEFLDAEAWWGPYTGQPSAVVLSLKGLLAEWKRDAPLFVEAVARLAVHSDQVTLAVDDKGAWEVELRRVALLLESHHDADIEHAADWRIAPETGDVDLGDPHAVAQQLHANLDAWVEAAVRHEVQQRLSGLDENSPWSRDDVRASFGDAWNVPSAWLTSALRSRATDVVPGTRRLGRRTIRYLADAVLFPTAVAHVLPELVPADSPSFSSNLEFLDPSDGNRQTIGFAFAMARIDSLESDAFLLLLSCSSLSPEMVRPTRRIGTAPLQARTRWRIGERTESGLVCSFSDDARRILAHDGWAAFKEHIESEINSQIGT